jgi:sugar lactone lactonase YvrE
VGASFGVGRVAVDVAGNVYFSSGNSVFKLDPAGNLARVAGTGMQGFSGDGGAAISAQLWSPYGVAVDISGNVYIADTSNNRVRKVSPAGIITTVAGNGGYGYSGDGGSATSASFYGPIDLAVDPAGNLYIADTNNYAIRKVSPAGIITTVAGNGTSGYSGDGGPATSAQLASAVGMALDSAGNLYFGDNERIRKVNKAGIVTTVAGNGAQVYYPYSGPGPGDGGPATSASFDGIFGVAVDAATRITAAFAKFSPPDLSTPWRELALRTARATAAPPPARS